MPINRINTNFKGIYRIPYSEESVQELKQNLLPTYINVTNQKAKFFVGRHPFFDSFASRCQSGCQGHLQRKCRTSLLYYRYYR